MIFKRIIFSFVGLGGVGGMVAGVVACGKTANAVLPVEYVITAENVSFRSDRSDARATPGLDSWNKGQAVATITPAQSALLTKIAPGVVGTLKNVISGFVGNYAEIEPAWKDLFTDINAQRSGSGSVMVEMSRLYFRDSGKMIFADGKTAVAPGEIGTVEYVVQAIHFDGYATTGNSPAEAFSGLMSPPQGHHWEVDLSADPIVLTITFKNINTAASDSPEDIDKASISKVEGVNFDVLESYAMSAKSQNLTQEQYRDVINNGPTADNYYKGRVSLADFKKIFGPDAKPVKVTTAAEA